MHILVTAVCEQVGYDGINEIVLHVIKDIFNYLEVYAGSATTVALIVLCFRVVYNLIIRKATTVENNERLWRRTLLTLIRDFVAAFYLYMVIAITFFSRLEGSTDIVNLKLFSTFSTSMQDKVFIVENVLMFIPLGIFVWWYGCRRYRYACLFFLLSCVIIEIVQYTTGRGKLEIDDILTNTVGAGISFTIVKLLKYFREKRK